MLFDLWVLRSYYIRKLSDKFWLWLVWKLPKPLVMWSTVRVVAHATSGEYGDTSVPDITAMDALKRWS
jgi:hypothetical protein